jgi:hypothetical protein
MEWIERRAGLIGVGALVVAAIALGVAIAHDGDARSDHRMFRVAGPGFAPFDAPGRDGAPMPRRYDAGPGAPIPPTDGFTLRRFDAGPGRALAVPGLAAAGAVHGELTVPLPNGNYQTHDFQRGTVTSLSSSSVTVKSSDGFTKTYTISKSLASGVSKGDEVQLRATVSNGKATVTSLHSIRTRG